MWYYIQAVVFSKLFLFCISTYVNEVQQSLIISRMSVEDKRKKGDKTEAIKKIEKDGKLLMNALCLPIFYTYYSFIDHLTY